MAIKGDGGMVDTQGVIKSQIIKKTKMKPGSFLHWCYEARVFPISGRLKTVGAGLAKIYPKDSIKKIKNAMKGKHHAA